MRFLILLTALGAAIMVPATAGGDGPSGAGAAGDLARLDAYYLDRLREVREGRLVGLSAELREALEAEDLERALAASNALEEALAQLHAPRLVSEAAPERLQILAARWGMGTRWRDVTETVRGMVAGDRLALYVTYRTLGDPAPRWKKTLFVVYARNGRIKTAIGAEDHRLTIE